MNELAYYLDRYYEELERKEALPIEGMGSVRDVFGGGCEGDEEYYDASDRLMALGNQAKNGSRGARQAHHKKLVMAG
jgi:hypothetical protein